MNSSRLVAFSDGVIAVIITIMVLELKVPHGESLDAMKPQVPVFLSYVLSFLYAGIYWKKAVKGDVFGLALSLWRAGAGQLVYLLTALLWLIPDRRIESTIAR